MTKKSLNGYRLLAWVVLSFGVSISLVFAFYQKQTVEREAVKQFAFASDQVLQRIQERLDSYQLILRAGAGLFFASTAVDRQEWKGFVEHVGADRIVAGVQGIGFSEAIRPHDLELHINRIRAEGFPEYQVWPEGERGFYSSIIYLEPFDARNQRAFGYDMFSEPVRRKAMEQARDSGEIALSGKVQLVQETDVDVQAGVLMYFPVYQNGMPTATVEQRRAALTGWVYSPFRMHDLMSGILSGWEGTDGRYVDLHIYDGAEASLVTLLYDSDIEHGLEKNAIFHQARTLDIHGKSWTLEFDRVGNTSIVNYAPVYIVLISGLGLSGLLFALLMTVIHTREKANQIAVQLTEDIRRNEEMLRESEFRWKFAIEGTGDGLWDWSINEGRVFFSKRWKTMLGYEEDEISGTLDEWLERIHPDDREKTLAVVRDYLDGKTPYYLCEHRARRKDGSYIWILDRGMVVSRSEDGKPLRMIGTHSDITKSKMLEATLRENEEQLQEAQRIAKIGSWRLDLASRRISWTAEVSHMFGLDPDLPSPDFTALKKLFTVESWDALNAALTAAESDGIPYEIDLEMVRSDGSHGWMHARGEAVLDEHGNVIALHGVASDITERKSAEEKLYLAASVFSHAREGILVTDADGLILEVNEAFTRITGYERAEVLGKNPSVLKSGRNAPEFYAAMWYEIAHKGYWSGEVWNRRKNGEVFPELLTINSIKDAAGKVNQYVGLFTDISHFKEHEQQLEQIAHYDALTGLPNRVLLTDRLQQAMAQARRSKQAVAVAFVDLDKFKEVNDQYGHEAGDTVLMIFADRMKQSLRAGDTIARLGGDEFVAVLPQLSDMQASLTLIERLIALAARPMDIGQHMVQVSASVGVTYYPQAEEVDGDLLMRQADMAMYQAKVAGRNCYRIFDIEHDRSLRGHHEDMKNIEQALVRDEFQLYYQPKVNMRSGELIGVEALIRWQHPERGLLSPAMFLSVTENNALSVTLGEWVINAALAQMKTWQSAGLHIPVSVNVSGYHLLQDNFVSRLTQLLSECPEVSPDMLELEVLESNALGDLSKVAHVINDCKKAGVTFALDDFGTGYSSLTYLKHLQAVTLKIDQSFVLDMLEDPEDLAILEGVLGLARAFRRQAVAEGVETLEHGEMLLNMGCEIGQGYAIAYPMPAELLPEWVAHWRPDGTWQTATPFGIRNLPYIYAIVEHRAWIRAFEAALKGERESPPALDSHQCNFGRWIDAELNAGARTEPGFAKADACHVKLHDLSVQMHLLYTQGRGAEALAQMKNLREASRDLVVEMKQLMMSGI